MEKTDSEKTEEYLKIRSLCLKHYGKKQVQEAIVQNAKGREIGVMYPDKAFGKRPEVLKFPGDAYEFAKQGVTSFHVSEERWANPLQLRTGMRRQEMDDLRTGWDLVIDIDGKTLEFSTEAAELIIKALKYHNINSITCKFSGNKGFHIGVPYESFPKTVKGKEIAKWFPEGARAVAAYLKEMIRPYLAKNIAEKHTMNEIQQITNLKFPEIVKDGQLDPYSVLEIDSILISSRHLYRSQYSINEKSGLVSLPLNPDKIRQFKRENASPANMEIQKYTFLDTINCTADEAKTLLIHAMDFSAQNAKKQFKQDRYHNIAAQISDGNTITRAAEEINFSPCIKKILEGLSDGKKRSLFVLINFLTSAGWDYSQIESLLEQWNQKNESPLREGYIQSQINYHKTQKKKILPPNCANNSYYKDIGICCPDSLCIKIKNPVNYTLIKEKRHKKLAEQQENQQENQHETKKRPKKQKVRQEHENNIQ